MVFLKQVHNLPLALRNLPTLRIAIHFKPWLGDHIFNLFWFYYVNSALFEENIKFLNYLTENLDEVCGKTIKFIKYYVLKRYGLLLYTLLYILWR